jgi:hypothetical protein
MFRAENCISYANIALVVISTTFSPVRAPINESRMDVMIYDRTGLLDSLLEWQKKADSLEAKDN